MKSSIFANAMYSAGEFCLILALLKVITPSAALTAADLGMGGCVLLAIASMISPARRLLAKAVQ